MTESAAARVFFRYPHTLPAYTSRIGPFHHSYLCPNVRTETERVAARRQTPRERTTQPVKNTPDREAVMRDKRAQGIAAMGLAVREGEIFNRKPHIRQARSPRPFTAGEERPRLG